MELQDIFLRRSRQPAAPDKETTADASGSSVSGGDKTEQETASSKSSPKDTLKAAELKATQYDYDGAIELLKADTSYSSDSDMQSAVKKYEETKASCKFMATGRSDTCFLSHSYQRSEQSF